MQTAKSSNRCSCKGLNSVTIANRSQLRTVVAGAEVSSSSGHVDLWWELIPPESDAPRRDLEPIPNSSLLFDNRALRARKPSVRFRNTITVPVAASSSAPGSAAAAAAGSADGNSSRAHTGVPLHVSNYAVLVTDVPDSLGVEDEQEER